MKRGAESQLTKDGDDARDDEDSEDSSSGQGFQKATETVLGTRNIRPLPSRAGRTGTPKPAFGGLAAPNPANPFLAGSSSTPPTSVPPFSTGLFSKPLDKRDDATPAESPFSQTSSPSPFSIPSAISTSSGVATNTSKVFASILNTSSTNIFSNPVSNSPPSTTPSTSKASNGITESVLTKYYTNVRGLNVSLLNSIKNSVEGDPFCDLTSTLESYKTHWSRIQKEYDESSEKEKTKSSASGPPTAPLFGTTSMSTISTPDLKASSGFVFGSGSKLSGNLFGPPNASESSNSTTSVTSTNIFGPPSSSSFFGNVPKPSATTTTAFSTTGPSSDTAFRTLKPPDTDKISTSSETPSVFGSSTAAFQSAKLPFPLSSSISPKPFVLPATNLFGSHTSSIPAFGASADKPNSDKKPTPSIGFGFPSSLAKNTNVFYGFGSSPQSTSTSTSTIPAPTAASEKESQETITEDATPETGSEGNEPKEPGLLKPNPHDEEGVGEENEETIHAVKLKAYRMRKTSEEGGSGWAELGMGILRLKKDKDTDARRMLLRNSINGKITINFKIYAGLKPSISKKALTFVGHSDGVSQTYCVRLPSEEQASELKATLEREIEFVKAKESS